jgi:hypothetical protein
MLGKDRGVQEKEIGMETMSKYVNLKTLSDNQFGAKVCRSNVPHRQMGIVSIRDRVGFAMAEMDRDRALMPCQYD